MTFRAGTGNHAFDLEHLGREVWMCSLCYCFYTSTLSSACLAPVLRQPCYANSSNGFRVEVLTDAFPLSGPGDVAAKNRTSLPNRGRTASRVYCSDLALNIHS